MWFSSNDFFSKDSHHLLHETSSQDGISWAEPSAALIEHAYAPTVIKEGDLYRLWFTHVETAPWSIRYAESRDGTHWTLHPEPALIVDQPWELGRLFYPTIMKVDDQYLMWYGSYCNKPGEQLTTSLGLAISADGIHWRKNPDNPVFGPDRSRPWESHYTTSQSILREPDGSWRMWYASRPQPPFVHKYFAICTARWDGPVAVPDSVQPNPARDLAGFKSWQHSSRAELCGMLGIPTRKVALAAESRGSFRHDGLVIEKWIFASEPGSRVPAVLYRPDPVPEPRLPAIVMTFGHGGSKSQPEYCYTAQVFAKLGIACLCLDPIGEEERHVRGGMGTRAHDPQGVHARAQDAGRLIMGKLVWDTMRGLDFLLERRDIDPGRIGVSGNSLGGAKAGWMAALDPRLHFAAISGWAFAHTTEVWGKFCTRVPNLRMRGHYTWRQYLSLAAPHCAIRILNGDADTVIDKDGDGRAWLGTNAIVADVSKVYEALGHPGGIGTWYEPGGGHRPYPIRKPNLEWIARTAKAPGAAQVSALPEIRFGDWCKAHGIALEPLYGTPLHLLNAIVVDLNLQPIPREQLAVLQPGEVGQPAFTLEGWLDTISFGR
jgi:hypothetical protein